MVNPIRYPPTPTKRRIKKVNWRGKKGEHFWGVFVENSGWENPSADLGKIGRVAKSLGSRQGRDVQTKVGVGNPLLKWTPGIMT